VPLIRYYGHVIQGKDPSTGYPTPWAPQAAENGTITPSSLRWAGSAWARGYNIDRRREGDVSFVRLVSNLPDNVATPGVLYNDTTATIGQQFTYRIQAVGLGGAVSDWFTLGPLTA
jgi:hypothetical protein